MFYVGYSGLAIFTGDKNPVEILNEPIRQELTDGLTFEDMRAMPVVHFDYLASSVYLDPYHMAFHKNIFVALQQTTRFENGTKTK